MFGLPSGKIRQEEEWQVQRPMREDSKFIREAGSSVLGDRGVRS